MHINCYQVITVLHINVNAPTVTEQLMIAALKELEQTVPGQLGRGTSHQIALSMKCVAARQKPMDITNKMFIGWGLMAGSRRPNVFIYHRNCCLHVFTSSKGFVD